MSLPRIATALLLACTTLLGNARADDTPNAQQQALQAAWAAAGEALQQGEITLGKEARLTLPEHTGFIPARESAALLSAMGNTTDDSLLGMIVPLGEAGWMLVASWHDTGYIKDEDARNWDVDDMLASLREGTEAGNAHRRQLGVPEMEIVGWVQKPSYDSASNRLVWALQSRDKGQPDSPENGINYNTYALGRSGYISLNLVTAMQFIEAEKAVAHDLLDRLAFNDGHRYADFNPATDKVAEYGLAALVGGVAAKKAGLFAVLAAFLAKFAKFIVIGAVALFALLRKVMGKKDAS